MIYTFLATVTAVAIRNRSENCQIFVRNKSASQLTQIALEHQKNLYSEHHLNLLSHRQNRDLNLVIQRLFVCETQLDKQEELVEKSKTSQPILVQDFKSLDQFCHHYFLYQKMIRNSILNYNGYTNWLKQELMSIMDVKDELCDSFYSNVY